MSEIETINSAITESLISRLKTQSSETATEKLQRIQRQIKNIPSVLDYDTLSKLRNGEYEISLKEYTSMNNYNTTMSALYGDKSANPFQQYIDKILNTNSNNDSSISNAKTFVDKMRENGLSNSSAVKLYSALKSYSLISSFKNYNFVNAKT